ncbi:hypothetical protein BH09VER1_BH09VER1_07080 [soil metagenome]
MTVKHKYSTSQVVAVAAVILAVALLRVAFALRLPEWSNFSPLMAMAFCGGLFLPGVMAWVLPLAVLLLSNIGLNLALGYDVVSVGQLAVWACFAVGVGAGRWLAQKESFGGWAFLGAILGDALLFYVVTNTVSWFSMPVYARTAAGWVQALTTGLPQYAPTWIFFRNSLVSDFLFVGLILGVRAMALRTSSEATLARS